MEKREEFYRKYDTVLKDIKQMLQNNERGKQVAIEMHTNFLKDLEIHQGRMQEQYDRLKTSDSKAWEAELSSAETTYEAARKYMLKFGKQ